ncbi:hypothetical protein H6G27_29650 [Nostoc linckia FACHB-104]|nr:hypothetical protein [Nostoc linckia FACHB-104]
MQINRRTHKRIASLAGSIIHNPYLTPDERSHAGSYLEGAKPRYARLQVKPIGIEPKCDRCCPTIHQ